MAEDKVPWIETPLIWSRSLSRAASCDIYLKLENLQPSGSFKSRAVGNFMLQNLKRARKSLPNGQSHRSAVHFFCSSGGNAGLGCVHAANTLQCPATIVVPMSTTEAMIAKLRAAGAEEVVQRGASWVEADTYLREELLPKVRASGVQPVYVPPFDAQEVWDGNSRIVDELTQQLREVDQRYPTNVSEQDRGIAEADALICSVGGGGLFSGIMQGLHAHNTKTKVVTAETVGADALSQSVAADKLVTLPGITSIATSLGARTVCKRAFEYAVDKKRVTTIVLEDKEAVSACRRFADEERMLVEPACGVSLAICYSGRLKRFLPELTEQSRVVVVVCGGSNVSLEILNSWVKEYGE